MNLPTGPSWVQKARKIIDPPHSKHDFIVVLSSLLLLLAIPLTIVAIQSRNVIKSKADIGSPGIVSLINQYRAQNGLGPLAEDQRLANAACWMANDMAAKNYFSHTDSLGRDPFQRMKDFGGYGSEYGGENLAVTFEKSTQQAFEAWRNSPGHNVIMLGDKFTRVGLGVAYSPTGNYRWYWVTNFASSLDSSYPHQPLTSNCVSNQNPAPPTVDIKANGLNGPISVNYNAAANISWTSSNANSCSVSPNGWGGTSGSQSTGNLTAARTYVLTCSGEGGTSSDSVTINIASTSSNLTISPNPCVIPSGQTSCKTTISWTTSGYNNVILCKSVGTTSTFITPGLTGTSTQTLLLNQTYNFFLRSSPTNSCTAGTYLKGYYANVYVFNINGGDVNCDGVVNGLDSLEVLRYVSSLPGVSIKCSGGLMNLTAANFVSDGVVDALDALYILKKVGGLLTTSPLKFTSTHIDSDGDYLEDSRESAHSCMSVYRKDAGFDPDKDSLTGAVKLTMNNSLEISLGTNPCKSDTDNDGFSDAKENYLGTSATKACATTSTANDEVSDNWPVDFNDDKRANISDVLSFNPVLNSRKGDSKYKNRFDLNFDASINTLDLAIFNSYLNKSCV